MKNNVNIDEVISKSIKEAIREYDKEKSIAQKDRRLHNTRLLMKNYNKLKEHVEDVKADVEFEISDAEDKVWLTSIARTKLRTMKMMAYIDSALEILEIRFRKNCEEYKFKAFTLYYLDEKSNEEIQEALDCGKNTPKKWSDVVLEELSLLLWGIETLGM